VKDRTKQREASRRHYEANKDRMKERAKAYTIKKRIALRRLVMAYLLEHPCVDCGEDDPVVLEFDHREPAAKSFNIGDGVSRAYGTQRVKDEIAKCDVRCANCHRRKTSSTVWAEITRAEIESDPRGHGNESNCGLYADKANGPGVIRGR
jgi:hypothetical protein